jgi:hypothetical protein
MNRSTAISADATGTYIFRRHRAHAVAIASHPPTLRAGGHEQLRER